MPPKAKNTEKDKHKKKTSPNFTALKYIFF